MMREEPRQTDEQCSAVVVAEVVGLLFPIAAAFKQLLSRERRQSPKGLPSLARWRFLLLSSAQRARTFPSIEELR